MTDPYIKFGELPSPLQRHKTTQKYPPVPPRPQPPQKPPKKRQCCIFTLEEKKQPVQCRESVIFFRQTLLKKIMLEFDRVEIIENRE